MNGIFAAIGAALMLLLGAFSQPGTSGAVSSALPGRTEVVLSASQTDSTGTVKKVNGKYYYYVNGKKQKPGWVTVNGKTYYFSKSTGAAAIGTKKIGNYTYVFASNGVMYKNTYIKDSQGKQWYLNSKGRAIKGLKSYKNTSGETRISYFNGDGTVVTNQRKKVGDKNYYFNTSGVAATNNTVIPGFDGEHYFPQKDGTLFNGGWKTVSGKTYYFAKSTGAAVTGVKKIGGEYYIFGDNGALRKNTFYNDSNGGKWKLDKDGKSVSGFVTTDKGATYYYHGDGTYEKSGLFEADNNLYFASSTGEINKKGYRKVDGKMYYFDEKTGAAVTGFRIGRLNGVENRGMYFDPKEESGFRTGIQKEGSKTYYLNPGTGAALGGFATDWENKKLYYCDQKTYQMQTSGTVVCGSLRVPVKADGSLDYAKAYIEGGAKTVGEKAVVAGFTQMFKPTGPAKFSPNTPMNSMRQYDCAAFVAYMYYEAGIMLADGDMIIPVKRNSARMDIIDNRNKKGQYSIGDIALWNIENCGEKLDEDGEPWKIDANRDGICDRIHKENEYGDGINYHVHHVSLMLPNGQSIEAVSGKGIIVRDMPPQTDDYYVVAYAHAK